MKSIRLFFILAVTLPLIFACGSSNKDSNQTKVEAVSKVADKKEGGDFERVEVNELKSPKIKTQKEIEEAKREHKVLNKLGIETTDDGKIVIEPKKTKEFFEKLSKILIKEGEEFKNKNADLKSEDLGIEASKDKIIIDTKKTKSFLERLSKDLEEMAEDISKEVDGI